MQSRICKGPKSSIVYSVDDSFGNCNYRGFLHNGYTPFVLFTPARGASQDIEISLSHHLVTSGGDRNDQAELGRLMQLGASTSDQINRPILVVQDS